MMASNYLLNCLLFRTVKTRRRQKKCSQKKAPENLKATESKDEVKNNTAEGSMETSEGIDNLF